jgi:hypothetical protein
MSLPSMLLKAEALPPLWRQRLILLFIIACFVVPLATAWLLVGTWHPGSSVQHGDLLNPARPLTALRFTSPDHAPQADSPPRGYWLLIWVNSATACAGACQTALYDMRQVRLALGKDMDRVKTLLLLDGSPDADLRQWLASEHPALTVGVAEASTRTELSGAFGVSSGGEWIYLVDPLNNLLMRYPATVEPRGMLKDLQRLLRLSKIG